MSSLIFIVEDDTNIREIESFALKNSGYLTEDFEDARTFYTALEKRLPDLILLDIMLPDEDGLSIVEKLRHNFRTSRIPIILVTAKTSELDKVKGLDIGADDYLTKPFGVMELISRVKALLRRSSSLVNESVQTCGAIQLDSDKRQVVVDNQMVELTFKEFELLKLLMVNAGNVLTRTVLMEKIWGTDFEGESRTLDMHIKTLRHKLGDEGFRIKTIRNVGYQIQNDANI